MAFDEQRDTRQTRSLANACGLFEQGKSFIEILFNQRSGLVETPQLNLSVGQTRVRRHSQILQQNCIILLKSLGFKVVFHDLPCGIGIAKVGGEAEPVVGELAVFFDQNAIVIFTRNPSCPVADRRVEFPYERPERHADGQFDGHIPVVGRGALDHHA